MLTLYIERKLNNEKIIGILIIGQNNIITKINIGNKIDINELIHWEDYFAKNGLIEVTLKPIEFILLK